MEILSVLKASALSAGEPDWDEVEPLTDGDTSDAPQFYADDVPFPALYVEGSVRRIAVNAYERYSKARRACLDHFGYRCMGCGFDFAELYGENGKEYIHVHHLKDLVSIRKSYQVNPIEDLIPVCPNCHAMIHRSDPMLTIQQLQSIVKVARRPNNLSENPCGS
jgi:5-methylcytosine-specific restriction protein A